MPAPPDLAAADNLSPEFLLVLGALGFEVVIVRFQAMNESPVWDHAGIELELEKELRSAGAGQYDSEAHTPGSRWFFYHCSDLAKAMQTLKTAVETRGLLEIATLLHVETANELRVYFPATAEALSLANDE